MPLLCEAIKKTQSSLSTDVRDTIFALLGICEHGAELVPKDLGYQHPVEVIIMHITKALIRKTGCLDFILLNVAHSNTRSHGKLPNWTPDWLSHSLPGDAYLLAESRLDTKRYSWQKNRQRIPAYFEYKESLLELSFI